MALDQGSNNLNGPTPNGVPEPRAAAQASPPESLEPAPQRQLSLPAFSEPRSDQLDIRRQLHTIRKHLVWVLVMSLLSGAAAALIGIRGELPWRGERTMVVRRDSFTRVSERLYSFVSEDTLAENVSEVAKKNRLELIRDLEKKDKDLCERLRKCTLSVKSRGMNKLFLVAEGPDRESVKLVLDRVGPAFNQRFEGMRRELYAELLEKKQKSESELVKMAGELNNLAKSQRRADVIRVEFERENLKYETLLAKERALRKEAGEELPAPDSTGKPGVSLRVQMSATDLKRKRLVEQIVTLEMSQADYSNRYTVDHPRVRSISAKLTRLRQELASLAPPEPEVASSGGREIDALKVMQASIIESGARRRVLEEYLAAAERKVAAAGSGVQRQIRSDLLRREMIMINQSITRTEALRTITPLVLLVHTRGNVVGAILNRADHRALGYMSYYGAKYGYGYGYGYRYGYRSYK